MGEKKVSTEGAGLGRRRVSEQHMKRTGRNRVSKMSCPSIKMDFSEKA